MLQRGFGSVRKNGDTDGLIFDIQKYSIHDGPGIRTIVFLKGCPLRCLWCSNPESQLSKPELIWERQSCIHCQKCNSLCPEGAISDTLDGEKVIDRTLCTGCGICDVNCYANSIQLVGRYVCVTEVLREVEKDVPFYEESGGGITLGGGEPLMQPQFAKELLRLSKDQGINTAVETAGHVFWKNIECVVKYTDLFLYDIKTLDDDIHKRCTGYSNKLILENARRLCDAGADIIVRVPVIPGINDANESIYDTAEFARTIGAKDIELLPYHKMGEAKYRQLGRKYCMDDISPLSKERIAEIKKLACSVFMANKGNKNTINRR